MSVANAEGCAGAEVTLALKVNGVVDTNSTSHADVLAGTAATLTNIAIVSVASGGLTTVHNENLGDATSITAVNMIVTKVG